jgi:hypothetical protein
MTIATTTIATTRRRAVLWRAMGLRLAQHQRNVMSGDDTDLGSCPAYQSGVFS